LQNLETIFNTYRDMVFRICSRYCKDTREAEDLTQEVFLHLGKALRSFRGDSGLGTWIYRVATNRCLSHLRKLKSRKGLYVEYLDTMVVHNMDSGGDKVLAKIDLEAILGNLRPSVRQMLFLSLAEGLSYRETAEVMNLSKEAVAKTVARFLTKYRKKRPQKIGTLQGSGNTCL
jgi:RNA polymerase sigma factor (sigma-70 family)